LLRRPGLRLRVIGDDPLIDMGALPDGDPAAIEGATNSQHLSAETASRPLHPRARVHSSRSQAATFGTPVQGGQGEKQKGLSCLRVGTDSC